MEGIPIILTILTISSRKPQLPVEVPYLSGNDEDSNKCVQPSQVCETTIIPTKDQISKAEEEIRPYVKSWRCGDFRIPRREFASTVCLGLTNVEDFVKVRLLDCLVDFIKPCRIQKRYEGEDSYTRESGHRQLRAWRERRRVGRRSRGKVMPSLPCAAPGFSSSVLIA